MGHFYAVPERITACQSISPSDSKVLTLKIDSPDLSGVSSSSGSSSSWFMHIYSLKNKAKEYDVIPHILLT